MHIRIEQSRGNVGGKDHHMCEWETTGFWYNASKIPPCFSPIQRWRGWLLWLEIPSIAMKRLCMELKLKEEKSVIMLHVSISCDGVHMCTKYTGREERGSGWLRVFFLVTSSGTPTYMYILRQTCWLG